MFHSIGLLVIILIILVGFVVLKKKESYYSPQESAILHATKCLSCDNPLMISNGKVFVGQKSKCYSCEKQAMQSACGNPLAIYKEHPLKYYSMPPMKGMGYPKAGYI